MKSYLARTQFLWSQITTWHCVPGFASLIASQVDIAGEPSNDS
jgi:hypothetical protein